MGFYSSRKVLVTGGTGFLGSHVTKALLEAGAEVTVASRHPEANRFPDARAIRCDLLDPAQCRAAARGMDYVFHIAAFGFGIGANIKAHAELFTKNTTMSVNMLDAAAKEGAGRYLYCSSSSVYNGKADVLDDRVPWSGEPHPSESGFGWAKRTAEVQARIYHENTDVRVAIVRPSNPYGPMDLFDPQRSHVIPAMILRALAKEKPFTVWGTGRAQRSFVHASETAEAMLLALEKYAECDPLNIASARRTSIAEVARIVLDSCGHGGAEIAFDTTKPEGHPGRFPTVDKTKEKIGWEAKTSLRDGVAETVGWYLKTQAPGVMAASASTGRA